MRNKKNEKKHYENSSGIFCCFIHFQLDDWLAGWTIYAIFILHRRNKVVTIKLRLFVRSRELIIEHTWNFPKETIHVMYARFLASQIWLAAKHYIVRCAFAMWMKLEPAAIEIREKLCKAFDFPFDIPLNKNEKKVFFLFGFDWDDVLHSVRLYELNILSYWRKT